MLLFQSYRTIIPYWHQTTAIMERKRMKTYYFFNIWIFVDEVVIQYGWKLTHILLVPSGVNSVYFLRGQHLPSGKGCFWSCRSGIASQWWIQNLLDGGHHPKGLRQPIIFSGGSTGLRKTYYLLDFCRKLHGNERNWTKRGNACPWRPLGPPMILAIFPVNCIEIGKKIGQRGAHAPSTPSTSMLCIRWWMLFCKGRNFVPMSWKKREIPNVKFLQSQFSLPFFSTKK